MPRYSKEFKKQALALLIPNPIAEERVQVGVEIELVSVGLDGEDGPGSNSRIGEAGLCIRSERRPGTTRQFAQQPPIPPKGGTQDPRNGPHQLTVIERFQDLLGRPLEKGRHLPTLPGELAHPEGCTPGLDSRVS